MNPDQLLARVLRDVADEHVPVVPDLRAITAGGRRRRRARDVRRAVTAAVCVVACLVVVSLVVDPFDSGAPGPVGEPGPSQVTDLPVGDRPHIPYCSGDREIRGAGAPVAVGCSVMLHRGGTTLLLDQHGVSRLADGGLELLDPRDWSSWFPALSQDGRWAAWVTSTPQGVLMLGFDLTTGNQVAEEPWPTGHGWVAGIDDLGRVYFQSYGPPGEIRALDLRTGESMVVSGVPGHGSPSIKFVTADGFGLLTGDGVVSGMVTADGRFTQQQPVDRGWSVFSPDRSLVVHERDGQLVVDPTTGGGGAGPGTQPLQLPTEGEPVWYPVWESAGSVLVQFDPEAPSTVLENSNGLGSRAERTWLLRCSVEDGGCEVALPPGSGGRIVGPVLR